MLNTKIAIYFLLWTMILPMATPRPPAVVPFMPAITPVESKHQTTFTRTDPIVPVTVAAAAIAHVESPQQEQTFSSKNPIVPVTVAAAAIAHVESPQQEQTFSTKNPIVPVTTAAAITPVRLPPIMPPITPVESKHQTTFTRTDPIVPVTTTAAITPVESPHPIVDSGQQNKQIKPQQTDTPPLVTIDQIVSDTTSAAAITPVESPHPIVDSGQQNKQIKPQQTDTPPLVTIDPIVSDTTSAPVESPHPIVDSGQQNKQIKPQQTDTPPLVTIDPIVPDTTSAAAITPVDSPQQNKQFQQIQKTNTPLATIDPTSGESLQQNQQVEPDDTIISMDPTVPVTTAEAIISVESPQQNQQFQRIKQSNTSPLAMIDPTVPVTTTAAVIALLQPSQHVQQTPLMTKPATQTVIQTSNPPIQILADLQTSATQIKTAPPAPISTGHPPVSASSAAISIQSEDEVLTIAEAVSYSYTLNGNLQTGVMTITTVMTPIVKNYATTVIAGDPQDPQASNTDKPIVNHNRPVNDSVSKFSFDMVLIVIGFLLNFGISF